jgi:hypothetical protein
MKMEIPNRAIIKAYHDWGDWYRAAEYGLIDFVPWLKERWGVDLQTYYNQRKPKGFYSGEMVDKGKAALFMLKYYD